MTLSSINNSVAHFSSLVYNFCRETELILTNYNVYGAKEFKLQPSWASEVCGKEASRQYLE
jgi:hypothetical protein